MKILVLVLLSFLIGCEGTGITPASPTSTTPSPSPAPAPTPPGPGDTRAPVVSLTSGTISISATASDDTGVVGVQFRVDGQALGAEDTAPPYAVTWNTAYATSGTHSLTAVARDAAGNQTISSARLSSLPPTRAVRAGPRGVLGCGHGRGKRSAPIRSPRSTPKEILPLTLIIQQRHPGMESWAGHRL